MMVVRLGLGMKAPAVGLAQDQWADAAKQQARDSRAANRRTTKLPAQAVTQICPVQSGTDTAHSVLLVENSRALASAVAANLNAIDGIDCVLATTMAEARREIDIDVSRFFVAVVCLSLADAPHGEIVDVLKQAGLRVIVLTGFLDEDRRDRHPAPQLVDPFHSRREVLWQTKNQRIRERYRRVDIGRYGSG